MEGSGQTCTHEAAAFSTDYRNRRMSRQCKYSHTYELQKKGHISTVESIHYRKKECTRD